MNREQAYMRMLDASANMQWNVAMILEAKATEAEKIRNWMVNHLTSDAFTVQQDLLKETMQVHDQVIEMIEGLNKLGQGMNGVLKAVVGGEGGSSEDGMGGMFSGNFDMGDQ
ncbi:restriction endonuclease subunit S [Paenibacillus sambharensis]|uniref:Restriction endonuclease subunit S n=1 Tax=Paenibacillus sambharensis TaxID=1803190 RepID=A0A2W1L792_9BACL|nr:restriction endonuclease subunit S [Paenibacillus sambharensis]PZD95136.1 restriction endonuclease subunit S [Paenibacillus sambharensis]